MSPISWHSNRSLLRLSVAAIALAASAPGVAAFAQSGPQGSGIQVQQLGAVNPFQVGVGNPLPQSVWSSGYGASLEATLTALPAGDGTGWTVPLAARLAERALLSSGQPPAETADSFALATLRADRALATGRADPVFELLDRTPRLNESDVLSRLYAETAFALGNHAAACRAAEALLDGRDSVYWLRARAACYAFNNNIAAAELTAELARSSARSPVFDALFDALTLGGSLPARAAPTTGLELAVAHAIAPDQVIQVADTAPQWLKRAAERTGPAIAMPELLSDAMEAAVSLEGAEREAVLGALTTQDLDRRIAAEALALRLEDAAAQGRFVEAARAYGPEVATLPMSAETLVFGPRFVLAAILVDDLTTARIWRDALMDGPPRLELERPDTAPLLEPGIGPATLAPPPSASQIFDAPEDETWEPPAPAIMVALDYAMAVARNDLTSLRFEALLAARIESGDPRRLAEAAALVAVGAKAPVGLRLALLERAAASGTASAVETGPALLAAASGAVGETQLEAAHMIERHGITPEAYAAAGMVLAEIGLDREVRRLVLETIAEGVM